MTQTVPQPKSILVAVPTTGAVMKAKTAETLFGIGRVLARNGINSAMLNLDGSDVVTVRNLYANMVLNSGKFDGLLFVRIPTWNSIPA